MNSDTFEIVVMLTRVVVAIICALVTYKLIPYLQANTTAKQREDAEFWTKKAIIIAESLWKNKQGAGIVKKADVLAWLAKNNIIITADQADVLIDTIVKEFNKDGWPL